MSFSTNGKEKKWIENLATFPAKVFHPKLTRFGRNRKNEISNIFIIHILFLTLKIAIF